MTSNVDLVGAMGDLAVRSVARRNGIRGGTRNAQTAERSRDGKFLPKNRRVERSAPRCMLCRFGESYPNVTIDMVKEHRAHLEARRQDDSSTRGDDGQQHEHESDQPDESAGASGYRNGSTPNAGD
jgi:hypothetical protein